MKTPTRAAAIAVSVAAAIGALGTAGPATAAAPAPVQIKTYSAANGDKVPAALIRPNGEKPKTWGVATFKEGTSGTISPRVSKGGGTWTYGTGGDGVYKGCYSNYIHPKQKHSASVSIGNATDKDIQEKDVWAKAYARSGAAHTCNAYWGLY